MALAWHTRVALLGRVVGIVGFGCHCWLSQLPTWLLNWHPLPMALAWHTCVALHGRSCSHGLARAFCGRWLRLSLIVGCCGCLNAYPLDIRCPRHSHDTPAWPCVAVCGRAMGVVAFGCHRWLLWLPRFLPTWHPLPMALPWHTCMALHGHAHCACAAMHGHFGLVAMSFLVAVGSWMLV